MVASCVVPPGERGPFPAGAGTGLRVGDGRPDVRSENPSSCAASPDFFLWRNNVRRFRPLSTPECDLVHSFAEDADRHKDQESGQMCTAGPRASSPFREKVLTFSTKPLPNAAVLPYRPRQVRGAGPGLDGRQVHAARAGRSRQRTPGDAAPPAARPRPGQPRRAGRSGPPLRARSWPSSWTASPRSAWSRPAASPHPAAGAGRRSSTSPAACASSASTSAPPRSTSRVTDGQLTVLEQVSRADRRPRAARRPSWPLSSTSSASCAPRTAPSTCTAPASASPARCRSGTACRWPRRSCRGGTSTRCGRCSSQHLGCPVLVDNDVNIMALGEMHAGLARIRRRPAVRQDRHRRRLRHHRRRPGLPRRQRQRRRHRPHPGRRRRARCARAATSAASRRTSAARRWPGTPPRPPAAAGRSCSPTRLAAAGSLTSADVAAAARGWRPRRRRAGPRRRPPPRPAARRPGELLQPRHGRPRRRGRRWASVIRCSPRSAASSTAGRCRWPPATCPSCCPSSARRPVWSAPRG